MQEKKQMGSFKSVGIAKLLFVLLLSACSSSKDTSSLQGSGLTQLGSLLRSASLSSAEFYSSPAAASFHAPTGFFVAPTACAGFTVEEDQVFTCHQTGSLGDIWYFGPNHTCNWLQVEQELGLIFGTPKWGELGECTLHIQAFSSDPAPLDVEYVIEVLNAAPALILPVGSINEDQGMSVVFSASQVEANEESAGFGSYAFDDLSTVGSPLCKDSGELAINSINGEVRFKPTPDYFGVCYLNIAFDDGQGEPNSIVSVETEIEVIGINDAPVVTLQTAFMFLQDQSVQIIPNPYDADGDTLSFSFGPSHTCVWAMIDVNSGEITGTPDDDQVGVCTLAVLAFDGLVYSNEASSTIEVKNLRPTLSIPNVSISVGLGLTVILSDAQVQSSDEGFGLYSFDHASITGARCVDHGILNIHPTNGEITFDPDDTYFGVCEINVVFDDQNPTDHLVSDRFTVFVGGNPALTLNLTSPANGSYINSLNQSAFGVAGVCSEVGQNVTANIGSMVQSTTCQVDQTFSMSLNLSSLLDSSYLLEVTHFDAALNQKTAIAHLTKDSIAFDNMVFTLINPGADEGFVSDIEIEISGLPLDTDVLDIYSDSSCTTPVTASTALMSEPTQVVANISASGLSSCQTHGFYARFTDMAGNQSACSSDFTNYYFFGYSRLIGFSEATQTDEQIVNLNLTPINFDYSRIRSSAEDLRFFDLSGNKIHHYSERLDTSGLSTLALKIPEANTDQIQMYYCQPDVETFDDVLATFTYATPKNLYVDMISVGQNFGVASYIDSNNILFTGGNTASLNQNLVTNLPSVGRGPIFANGAISARARSSIGQDTIAAYTFLGTEFAFPASNGVSTWTFYNPSLSAVTLDLEGYNGSGVSITSQSFVVPAEDFLSVTTNTLDVVSYVSASDRLLAYFVSGSTEAVLATPLTTELFGVVSGSAYVSALNDGTTVTAFYSDGTSQSSVIDRGQRMTLTGGGTQGTGLAVRLQADLPIVANGINDGDGNDAFSFWPDQYLDKSYILPVGAQYLSVACPETTTLQVLDPNGLVLQTVQCLSPGPGYPGKAFLGSTSNVTSFTPGRRLVADKKVFTYYEYTTTDETNLMGPSHARPYSDQIITLSVGPEVGL